MTLVFKSHLLQTLPDEIIREHIIPYLAQPQPPILCEDIRSFHHHAYTMRTMYSNAFGQSSYHIEWMSYDIERYLNLDIPPHMGGYGNNIMKVLRRSFINRDKSREQLIKYLYQLEDHYPRDIWTFLGLMTPIERDEMHEFMTHFCV